MKKFYPGDYTAVAPQYELLDDGTVRHRESGAIRPHLYSGAPVPFKQGDRTICVAGTSHFPVGTEYVVTEVIGDVVYVQAVGSTKEEAICWERLDPVDPKP